MELSERTGSWEYAETYHCWMLEDVLYTPIARVPKFQRLSIFVPEGLMNDDGTPKPESRTVPIVFENNSAGYAQMPHTWLGGPRNYAIPYLEHGLIYVTCGCRGRESRDAEGKFVGKAPGSLVDLKTAIRFLRHNRSVLPGDWSRIISVGWSAGGALSSLLALTGDNPVFMPYLKENGAFSEESDEVFAAQIYCPIVDLEHADLAYEWCFHADKENENSPAGPAEVMTPFKEALSAELSRRYVEYFNNLNLTAPEDGKLLRFNSDGRSGSAYDYLMEKLEASASDYLSRLEKGCLPEKYSISDYLDGNYTYLAPAPMPEPPRSQQLMSLGELMCRPPKGTNQHSFVLPMEQFHGKNKHGWLSWDGSHAHISDLDAYVVNHRRRMKPCPAFDKLPMDSGENQLFGNASGDYVHFSPDLAPALAAIAKQFPEEAAQYFRGYAQTVFDRQLAEKVRLMNPFSFIGPGVQSKQASHYRIRVGAKDADTAFTVGLTLALKLENADCGTVDFAFVWDQPHCEADYPGEILEWIDSICKENHTLQENRK